MLSPCLSSALTPEEALGAPVSLKEQQPAAEPRTCCRLPGALPASALSWGVFTATLHFPSGLELLVLSMPVPRAGAFAAACCRGPPCVSHSSSSGKAHALTPWRES